MLYLFKKSITKGISIYLRKKSKKNEVQFKYFIYKLAQKFTYQKGIRINCLIKEELMAINNK
jgi:hypothetical protein